MEVDAFHLVLHTEPDDVGTGELGCRLPEIPDQKVRAHGYGFIHYSITLIL
jgi:hypothetical protein